MALARSAAGEAMADGVLPAPEFAPAKINLTLRVGPPNPDGRHPLDSLTVFAANVGDTVSVREGEGLCLDVRGPFAAGLSAGGDNLVLRAAALLAEQAGMPANASLTLDKRLPVASGIGGGSADAAAALRALNLLWGLNLPLSALADLGARLGADIPACVTGVPCRMVGTGEALDPAPALPEVHAVLLNCGDACSTGAVYAAFDARGAAPPLQRASLPDCSDLSELCALMRAEPNDLEAAAVGLVPSIAEDLARLAEQPGCRIARLSGSGATVFGLFETEAAARAAEAALRVALPGHWVAATRLSGRPGGLAFAR